VSPLKCRRREEEGQGWVLGDKITGSRRAGYGNQEVLTASPPPPPPPYPFQYTNNI